MTHSFLAAAGWLAFAAFTLIFLLARIELALPERPARRRGAGHACASRQAVMCGELPGGDAR